jgi:uncharacterized protein YprB with RNaseH-like and TPR domain
MQTLDELRRIIKRIESVRPPRVAPDPPEIALGGELIETGGGPLLVIRRSFPLTHRHGATALADGIGVPLEVLRLLARRDEGSVDARRLVFLDAETTGLAGGTGTYAFLVGAGYVEGDDFVVAQFFMRDFDDEGALLAALTPLLEGATGIVTFNGAGFDLPLLETRYVLARLRWHPLAHVDLLVPARRVWARCLPDCRLTTLERDVLSFARRHDVAGHEIPGRYFGFLRHGNARVLEPVFTHNRDDVLSLVALLAWFSRSLSCNGDTVLTAEELAGVGRLWEATDLDRALAYYHAALDRGLSGPAAHVVRLRLARAEKRRARWEIACGLWEAATRADIFDPRPWQELAMFYEHRRGDALTAHAIVSSALRLAHAARASGHVMEAFRYRLARLERRLSVGS